MWDFAEELNEGEKPSKEFDPADPQPGIYYDVPNAVYHSATSAISNSMLTEASESVSGLKRVQKAPLWESNDNDSFDLGEAFHCYVLEPKRFNQEYVVMENYNLRTNHGKEQRDKFLVDHIGKFVLTRDEINKVDFWKRSLMADPRASMWLSLGGDSEVVIVVKVTLRELFPHLIDSSNEDIADEEITLRIRADRLITHRGIVCAFDLKTTEDLGKYKRDFTKFRYHVQDAFYRRVLEHHFNMPVLFLFGVIQKQLSMRRCPSIVDMTAPETLDVANILIARDLTKIARAKKSGDWIEYTKRGLSNQQLEYFYKDLQEQ